MSEPSNSTPNDVNNTEVLEKPMNELYSIDLLSGKIVDNESGEVVYWGLDRQECAYNYERDEWRENGWTFSWVPQLQRCHDLLDGIFVGIWFCKHTNKWVMSSNGDHTMAVMDYSRMYDINEGMLQDSTALQLTTHLCEEWESLWGENAVHLDILNHPKRKAIAKVLKQERINMTVQMLQKNKCYTFILANEELRAIGLEKEDVAGREEDLKYGMYYFSSRFITPDKSVLHLVETQDIITGVKHPMLRHFDTKERMDSVKNSVGVGHVGIYVTEIKPSGGRKSCRRLFVYNPFWISIYDLKEYAVPRKPLDYNGMGYLSRRLDENDFKFMTNNRTAVEIMTEMILQKEVGVIQSYKSLREQYQMYMLWITECIDNMVHGIIDKRAGTPPTLETVQYVEDLPKQQARYRKLKLTIEKEFLAQDSDEIVDQIWDNVTSIKVYNEWFAKDEEKIKAFIAKQTTTACPDSVQSIEIRE